MTDRSGRHLDLDALADALAGERSGERHLRTCPACSDRLAELAAAEVTVAASLATLPEPALPEGLSDRLTAALAAEAVRRPAPVERRRRRSALTWLPAAAASLVLVLAGAVGWSLLRGPAVGGDTAASTADAAAGGGGAEAGAGGPQSAAGDTSAAVRNQSGTDYADPVQRTAVLPRVLAGTAVVPLATTPATPRTPALSATPAPAGPEAQPAGDPLDRLRDPGALEDCLSALGPPDRSVAAPLALDYARFGSAAALAVVQPDNDPQTLLLTVVRPDCAGGDAGTLLRTRLPRP